MIKPQMRGFFEGYVTAMLWANTLTDTGAEIVPVDATAERDNLAWSAVRELWDDAVRFVDVMEDDLFAATRWRSWEELGHDFALNRNGHGEGFWSRGMDAVGDRLSFESHNFGEKHLFSESGRITPE